MPYTLTMQLGDIPYSDSNAGESGNDGYNESVWTSTYTSERRPQKQNFMKRNIKMYVNAR